jgi:hypothetical protein
MHEQHTPGPWSISPDMYHDDELSVVGGESGDAVIATVWPMGDDEFGMEQQAANRLLVTAAPDLLREIKHLRDEYTRFVNLHDLTAHDWNGMYEVDEAIRKAEGVTSNEED